MLRGKQGIAWPTPLASECGINSRFRPLKERPQSRRWNTALQRSDEEIKFIRSPEEGEFDVAMLRVLAKEEASK
jgi:hypothetical protein